MVQVEKEDKNYICWKGGYYLVNLLNVFGPGLAILFIVFVEAAGVCWIYGVDRFSTDIECMLGYRPGIFWRICWAYISPLFLLSIFAFSILGYEEMISGDYAYPEWSINVGWVLTASSISCIPAYIIYLLYKTPGPFLHRVRQIMKPSEEYNITATTNIITTATTTTMINSKNPEGLCSRAATINYGATCV